MGNLSIGLSAVHHASAWRNSTLESPGRSSRWSFHMLPSRDASSFRMRAIASKAGSRVTATGFSQFHCGSSFGNSSASARSQDENSASLRLLCRLRILRTKSHSNGDDLRRWVVASAKNEEGAIPMENLEVQKSCDVQKKDSEPAFKDDAADDDSIAESLLNFSTPEQATLSDDDKVVESLLNFVKAESLLNFVKAEDATNGGNTLESLLNMKEMLPLSKKRRGRKNAEQMWYLFGAVASTTGILSLAAGAILYRFMGQALAPPADLSLGELPYADMAGTFLLTGGAAVGMEYWARWAHKVLWHADLWHMHDSHHRFRDGPFEKNDILAVVNAIPAIALMLCGFFSTGLASCLCFGAGLGMTIYGMAYMFVHDGLVHRRFPVGPVAEVPYLKRVAAAHRLHHSNAFGGVPYGLFLGCREIEELGRTDQLERFLKSREERKTAVTIETAAPKSDE